MYPGEVDHIWKEYYNDFTRECDIHLMPRMKDFYDYGQKTYLLMDSIGLKEKVFAIRCPGATVGHIRYDDSSGKRIITEIEFYNTFKMFYDNSINDIVASKKWIGKELILEEEK